MFVEVTAVAWIDPKDLNETLDLEFVVSKGRSIVVQLDDENLGSDEPIVVHRATSATSFDDQFTGAEFTAEQFKPNEKREILIHATHSKLGAI